MERLLYHHTTKDLERKSSNTLQFQRGLKKAINQLFPYEIDKLLKWLDQFLKQKPNLREVAMQVIQTKKKVKLF